MEVIKMNKFRDIISKYRNLIPVLLSIAFESYFIIGNLIISILTLLLSSVLTAFILSKKDKVDEKIKKEISAYSFLDSFLKGIEDNLPVRSCYESSTRYLISYQKAVSYDEVKENMNLNLYSFQSYFDYIMKKDSENQAFLLNYSKLRRMLYQKTNQLEDVLKSTNDSIIYSSIISMASLFILIILMAILRFSFTEKEIIFQIFSFVLISMLVPSYLFMSYVKEKKSSYEESI